MKIDTLEDAIVGFFALRRVLTSTPRSSDQAKREDRKETVKLYKEYWEALDKFQQEICSKYKELGLKHPHSTPWLREIR